MGAVIGKKQGINMETPIIDFVKAYKEKKLTRFHMPGHKGHVFFGWEPFDITEIKGADVLHHGDGIIHASEQNASMLFGSGATHYSTEGSTHCIKAMLAVLKMEQQDRQTGERQFLLAARNVHRSIVDACAILDLDLEFFCGEERQNLCSAAVTPQGLRRVLEKKQKLPLAVYVTSPDYLGQLNDIAGLASVCREWGLPLVVDNAHGAYLHFLEQPVHPLDLGAAMCCDSAHKTLPALTGAAYFHISREYTDRFEPYAAQALQLFGSTSPSYLTLQSLDLCNAYLADALKPRLEKVLGQAGELSRLLQKQGICMLPAEPLKLVIHAAPHGYSGEETAEELRQFQIECEYADSSFVVLMLSAENEERDFFRLADWAKKTMLIRHPGTPVPVPAQERRTPRRRMTIRDAVFHRSEMVAAKDAVGRICAAETISCPPAVPIAVSGEEITEEMAEEFLRYGITEVRVVTEQPHL